MSFPAMSDTRASSAGDSAVPRVALVVAAFAAIYVIWGSTYLAIRFAIESIPPLMMASVRFLIAGSGLYAWRLLRGASRPTRAQWRASAVAGTLMLGVGNGSVVVAEQWVPSGLTAVLVACVPLWMVVLDAGFASKARPSVRVRSGLLIGFVGVALLTGSLGIGEGGVRALLGAILLFGACASWAAGSLYVRHAPVSGDPLVSVAAQMITGGLVLAVGSVVTGEPGSLQIHEMTTRSVAAVAYLIVFGSLIAYSAYVWLLGVTTPARVGTYAYVNPVIALILGWALASEPINLRSITAAAVIVGSVVVIVSEGRGSGGRGAIGRGAG